MTLREVLEEVRRLNLSLSVDGDAIRVTGPLSDGLRQAIREHKAAILLHLRATKPPAPKSVLAPPPVESRTSEPAAAPVPVPTLPCPLCYLPFPGDPHCGRCETERQRLRRLAGHPPVPKCGWCGQPPGSNHKRCEECFRTYDRARFEGREREGIFTVHSDPKVVRAILDAALRRRYGREFPG